jgi:hypothetical protein
MALVTRFQEASLATQLKQVPCKTTNRIRYHTRKGSPRGLGVLSYYAFAILNSPYIQGVLPRRYSEIMTENDIVGINWARTKLNLIYRGMCMQTCGHLLALKEEVKAPE